MQMTFFPASIQYLAVLESVKTFMAMLLIVLVLTYIYSPIYPLKYSFSVHLISLKLTEILSLLLVD